MKYTLTVVLLSTLFCSCTQEKLHPLKHPDLEVIAVPQSKWYPGHIYIHDVMDYLFASEQERVMAKDSLLEAGFGKGEGKINYFYMNAGRITINGHVFNTVDDAREFLATSNLKKIRVFSRKGSTFPTEVKVDGISFYQVPWTKKHEPKINL